VSNIFVILEFYLYVCSLNIGCKVKELEKYNIELTKLKFQEYEYIFEGNDEFFACFEESLVEKGTFKAILKLKKTETLLQLHFDITGNLELICDRSLEEFDFPFEAQNLQILQFGDHKEELSDEMQVIPRGTTVINVAYYMYEAILLSIPMKKLHPKFKDEDNNSEYILVYSSESKQDSTPNLPEADPRWEELLKLKKDSKERK
jgi:uncharacterized metal-binding protein YceD (DUF177 family)